MSPDVEYWADPKLQSIEVKDWLRENCDKAVRYLGINRAYEMVYEFDSQRDAALFKLTF